MIHCYYYTKQISIYERPFLPHKGTNQSNEPNQSEIYNTRRQLATKPHYVQYKKIQENAQTFVSVTGRVLNSCICFPTILWFGSSIGVGAMKAALIISLTQLKHKGNKENMMRPWKNKQYVDVIETSENRFRRESDKWPETRR